MLSIKSIASTLGFGAGVTEQASIVAGKAIKDVATKAYTGVSSHEYSKDFKEFKQEFANGRQSGKDYVSTKMNKEQMKQLANNNQVQLITL